MRRGARADGAAPRHAVGPCGCSNTGIVPNGSSLFVSLAGQAAILAAKQAFLTRQEMLGRLRRLQWNSQRLSQELGMARQSATFGFLETDSRWRKEPNLSFYPVQFELNLKRKYNILPHQDDTTINRAESRAAQQQTSTLAKVEP